MATVHQTPPVQLNKFNLSDCVPSIEETRDILRALDILQAYAEHVLANPAGYPDCHSGTPPRKQED